MVARYICIIIVHATLKGPLGAMLYTIDKNINYGGISHWADI